MRKKRIGCFPDHPWILCDPSCDHFRLVASDRIHSEYPGLTSRYALYQRCYGTCELRSYVRGGYFHISGVKKRAREKDSSLCRIFRGYCYDAKTNPSHEEGRRRTESTELYADMKTDEESRRRLPRSVVLSKLFLDHPSRRTLQKYERNDDSTKHAKQAIRLIEMINIQDIAI